ncbi:hypothetical protein K466DRAFT_658638 [Polyporus arcularius HHB13444]|uniref:Uncharacterized protein n=1 Tax=Polyporus arcularius HHB13444 TaxID=1314778 RepID=A0A5C3PUZ9_9APHY|nr:hypothetical protein K466DRAFT_658638 [Polyporus arcularius HHB13444]
MSTTYEHAHSSRSPVMGYDVRKEIQRRLQHHVVSSTEEVLLWTHRLDPRDHKSWYSTAFQGWLQDHRLRSECDIHESQLAPLAIRGAASAEGACSVSWHFAWTRAFRAATQVSERVALETAIHEIVTAEEDWAQRMALPLLGLAWACVETAVKGGDDMQLHVAQLAVRLYGAFAKESPVYALVFGELLKRCAWEEFEAWWATGGQWSLSSSTYARNREALNLANSSVKFIGELYRVAMCPPSFPRNALSLLCPSRSLWVAIEQLRAVGSLFSYMDPSRLAVGVPSGAGRAKRMTKLKRLSSLTTWIAWSAPGSIRRCRSPKSRVQASQ